MISNLASYNSWKRSTLDRVATIYKREWSHIIYKHLQRMAPRLEHALEIGHLDPHVEVESIVGDLARVLRRHQVHTVKVAVSDGYREVTPKKQLSTWQKWPYWYPVEDTFVELADKSERDKITSKLTKEARRINQGWMADLLTKEKARYLHFLKNTFQTVAHQYFNAETDDEDQTTKSTVKQILGDVFKKSANQAEMIFRTETTRYFNDARLNYFNQSTEVDFIQIIAVTDGRVSGICESRDLYVVPIAMANQKKFKPPFHPNCRSIQSPLDTDLKSDREEVRLNLGSEFGKVTTNNGLVFTGKRAEPKVKLPKGWA